MKKVDINQKDFNSLVLEVLQAYQNYDDCDVEVPSEFRCRDLLIRLKNTPKDKYGNTICCSDYKVGYFRDSSNSFVYYDGNLLVDLYNLDKYEYKLIK